MSVCLLPTVRLSRQYHPKEVRLALVDSLQRHQKWAPQFWNATHHDGHFLYHLWRGRASQPRLNRHAVRHCILRCQQPHHNHSLDSLALRRQAQHPLYITFFSCIVLLSYVTLQKKRKFYGQSVNQYCNQLTYLLALLPSKTPFIAEFAFVTPVA